MRISPEFQVFCLALRRPQSPDVIGELRRILSAELQWGHILAGARRHRVASLLLSGLQGAASPHIPLSVISELRDQALSAAKACLAQMAELGRLAPMFARAGVRVLGLKGVVLSVQLYGNPALRNPRDIDLLVSVAEFAGAEAVLLGAGYRRPGATLSARQSAAYWRWIKDVGYLNPVNGIRIELHHRLSDNPVLLPCDFDTLWRERQEVEIAGATVAGLPRDKLALYLCAHGAGHCWEELRWLLDFAATLPEQNSSRAAVQMAEHVGLGAAMLHALSLAHDWLGLSIDEQELARARANLRVARLNRVLAHFYDADAWYQSPERGSSAGLLRYSLWLRLYTYLIKTDWRYWGYQVRREFVTPADWEVLRLPDSFFWAFPLVRPVGWLMRQTKSRIHLRRGLPTQKTNG
jgi:putative nucleotidyltransferase-like protein